MDGKGSPLLIRADANSRMGTGHIMRCIALAQAWQVAGGKVVFLSHAPDAAIRTRMEMEGIEIRSLPAANPSPSDLSNTLDLLDTNQARWLVLDGYHFDAEYQQRIRAAGYGLLVVDDMAHLKAYHADILLNQNLGAERLKYICDPNTSLLLGPQYVLLRQEFLAWRDRQRHIPDVARRVLLTMGGSDPENVTLKVLRALEIIQVDGLEIVVVVGGNNPHYKTLQSVIHSFRPNLRMVHDPSDMPELMAWADVAITAGGSTCWELMFMGLPSVVLVLAENQRGIAEGLESAGLAVNLGWFAHATEEMIADALTAILAAGELRSQMSSSAHELVDGSGCNRVIRTIVELMKRKFGDANTITCQ
jgi:UDP-2,4-diacetamido-2,4,6-trideoxy-beta-L-altropyranose hydrolase